MSLLFAELTATCNALGYSSEDGSKYFLDKECKEAVRDLIRFLRRDDENHEIRRHLGCSKILQTDLIPILIHHSTIKELFDLLLRLLVNLTTPALLLYNEEIPSDKVTRQHYISIVQHLQQYKPAFANEKIWNILSKKLTNLLNSEWHEGGEERDLSIVRMLILVRNVLHIPVDSDCENRPDSDASIHDQVLWALQEGGMINLILYIATSKNEQQYYFHVLEIMSLMLRDQNGQILATCTVERSLAEKERDEKDLMDCRRKERESKQKNMKRYVATRHSRFAGTYVVEGVKSISDNNLIVHSLNDLNRLTFDQNKTKIKPSRNRLPMKEEVTERRPAFSVRLFMKEFCIEFLNGAYNNVMRYIREMLVRNRAQANDESYYFWALRFFMEFNRHYGFQVKLVSETMSVQIFHFTQDRIEDWKEKLLTDKKKIHIWSKRMHLALKAYRELLNTLMMMYYSKEHAVKESGQTILSNIFYVVEYRELIMNLLNIYDPVKFSREYLKDLIEANHVFMKMMENLCKRHRALVVQKRPKITKRRKKKKMKQTTNESNDDGMEKPLEEKWNEISEEISETLNKNADEISREDIFPFDAASHKSMDQQKIDGMKNIRTLLRDGKVNDAISLFRACREVWPENNSFGRDDLTSEEEKESLKEIYFADIGYLEDKNENKVEEEEEDESSDEDSEGTANVSISEDSFEFIDFVKKFAKPKILQACSILLSNFENNTKETNHCLLKLLHRIAYDCKCHAMLFQASVFRIFQRILASDRNEYKELHKFVIYIIGKFTECAKNNRKIYMELLFWKSSKEAYEIEEGYGSTTALEKSCKVAWSEEQEDELRQLYAEYEKDKPSSDMVDWIHKNLIDQNRSRKSLIKKLKEMYLLSGNQKKGKGINTNRVPLEFSDAEIEQITGLYEEFKNAKDPIERILERLDVKRSKKRIMDKIVELKLVNDRKELHKKRSKKIEKNSDSNLIENDFDDTSSSEDDDDDEEENEGEFTTRMDNEGTCYNSLSSVHVNNLIARVKINGMKEALEWLISSLQEAVNELSDDEIDVPLVATSDNVKKAMGNKIFKKILNIFGFKKPSNEQESYWRIPGHWQSNDFRTRIQIIKDCLNQNLVDQDKHEKEQAGPSNNPENLSDIDDVSSNFKDEIIKDVETETKKKKRKRVIMDDSDSDMESDGVNFVEDINTKESKKLKELLDDSDEENDDIIKHERKRILTNDSDDE